MYFRPVKNIRLAFFITLFFLFVPFLTAPADAAAVVRKDAFLSQLLEARGFETKSKVQENAAAILKSGIVPESVGNLGEPVTRRDALRWMVHRGYLPR